MTSGSGDLLDLNFDLGNTEAPGSIATAPAPAVTTAPQVEAPVDPLLNADLNALLPSQPTTTEAPKAAPTTGDFEFDAWDDFQSSVPVAATSAPAPTSTIPPVQPPVQASANAATVIQPPAPVVTAQTNDLFGFDDTALVAPGTAATTEVDNFDPLFAAEKPKVEAVGPLGSSELDILGTSKGSDNLISFGSNEEFDPVAQTWQKEPPAPPQEAQVAVPQAEVAPAQTTVYQDPNDLLGLGGTTAVTAKTEAVSEEIDGLPVEDIEKKIIYVYHKGEKNIVAWYADTPASDIKEAILCACDAIMDGGFILREVQFTGDDEASAEPKEDGTVYEFEQFDQLDHEQTYILESAKERDDLKSIVGDRWRRLKVKLEPMLHVEAQKAIERMRRGSNLLKHTHYGFPHLRQFQLSDDRKRLVWYSGAKRKEDSVVNLDEVVEIRLGQTTQVFLHYRLPMLEHLSFSLVYGPKGSKTLDLTCKDEFEFDHWVTGLKAIFYHFKNRQISKEELLGHSKRFKKALDKNNVGIKLTKLPEVKEKGHVGLDDCIEIVTHTPQQLDTKMERLRERLRTMSQQVARLDHHATAEMEVDFALLTGQGPAYASVFVQDEDAQDEEMEIRRMHELVEQTTQLLQQARNELVTLNQKQKDNASSSQDTQAAAKGKKKENAACKHIDQLLWKAEVDLENVEDMYLRHIDNQKDTTTPFSITVADIEEGISRKFDEFRRWFN
jgi:hypothetical protein